LSKYSGGGDWYANPTSLPNLIKYCNANINTTINIKPATVEPGSPDLFSYPFIHMTGHGNVAFSDAEVSNLNKYMVSGGFLHIDNYGMDQYIRKKIKNIPNNPLVEVPANHHFISCQYAPVDFKAMNTKVNAIQTYSIFIENIYFYTFRCDLGDGWEDRVHDAIGGCRESIKMRANVINYIFNN
jgi:hypothetical protein